jgi:hypothetical protein
MVITFSALCEFQRLISAAIKESTRASFLSATGFGVQDIAATNIPKRRKDNDFFID